MGLSNEKYCVFLVIKTSKYHEREFLGGMWDDVEWKPAYYEYIYTHVVIKDDVTWEEAIKIKNDYTLKSNESISINKK